MPNTPYLDKSVRWRLDTGNLAFKELTYREVSDAILDSGLATEVLSKIGSGKEADVYLGLLGGRRVALKAYRYYRTSHHVGPVKAEGLGQVASREFELLTYAYVKGAPVPEPLDRDEYIVSMDYLGTLEGPAPRLKDLRLEEPERFLALVLEAVDRLTKAGIVHTDLSPFNILVHQDRPWIIDLADGLRVDRLGSPPQEKLERVRVAMERGLSSLSRYFHRYGLDLDVRALVEATLRRVDKFELLR